MKCYFRKVNEKNICFYAKEISEDVMVTLGENPNIQISYVKNNFGDIVGYATLISTQQVSYSD